MNGPRPAPAPSSSKAARAPVAPLDWAKSADAADLVEREMNASLGRRRRLRFAAATGTLAAMVLLTAVVWQTRQTSAPAQAIASRPIVTSPERQVLADGSVIELNKGARVEVNYSEAWRRVTLTEGEAHFQVARDRTRPFVVSVDGVEIRAVGTAFSIQRGTSRVQVLVTEGQVAIDTPATALVKVSSAANALPSAAGPAPGSPILVAAGFQLSVETAVAQGSSPPAVQAVPIETMIDRLAWRVPRLELELTPLDQIIDAFNHHGMTRLTLADPSLARLKLSGTLRADNVAVLLDILESSFSVKAERRSASDIVLYRAK